MSSPARPAPAARRFPSAWFAVGEAARLGLECLAALALVAEAVAFFWFRDSLSIALAVGLWGQWLATVAGLRYLGLFRVLSPVLVYDLVRAARRRRHFVVRGLYVTCLLAVLGWMLLINPYGGINIPVTRMPAFVQNLFLALVVAQFVALTLLTPAFVAGAIAEEKERKTLEFVLTTALGERDVVLGKLASRLAGLGLILLAGLPVLSLLPFLGGIEPGLVLGSFVATGLTVLSLGSLSIFNSVVFARPRTAVFMTYFGTAAYLILSGTAYGLLWAIGFRPAPGLFDVFALGNVFIAAASLARLQAAGVPLTTALAEELVPYALFHLVVSAGLVTWATARLRAVARRDAEGKHPSPARVERVPVAAAVSEATAPNGKPVPVRWWRDRPAVSDRPMLWKELFAEPRMRLHVLVKVLIGLLVVLSLLSICLLRSYYWVWNVGTLLGGVLLLRVAMHAAGSVNGEQHRDTLVGLLASPLEVRDILLAKWTGSVGSSRWGLVWLAAIWLLGVVTGTVSPLELPLLAATWLACAAFVAALGLWFSTVCRTSLLASFWTIFTALLLLPINAFCCGMVGGTVFLAGALSLLAGSGYRYELQGAAGYLGVVSGLSLAAWLTYRGTAARFARLHNRVPRRPGMEPPKEIPAGSPEEQG